MKAIFGMLIGLIFLVSCGEGGGSGDGKDSSPSDSGVPFSIDFPNQPEYGNTLNYVVRGESNKEFTLATFHLGGTCNQYTQLASSNRVNLANGVTLVLPTPNTNYEIFYKVSGALGELVPCSRLVVYNHDSVAPAIPLSSPVELLMLNGSRTNNEVIRVSMNSSYLPSDADGIRIYGNTSKTQFFGEILRENFANSEFTIIPNVTNTLYISLVDYAGNESPLRLANVIITHDSIPPTTPSFVGDKTIFTQNDSFSLSVGRSGDTNQLQFINERTQESVTRTGLEMSSYATLELSHNAQNRILVYAYDDVGNQSIPLILEVYHDNIAPVSPVVHSDDVITILQPFKGPSNTLRLIAEEDSVIELRSVTNNILATAPASDWMNGVNFTFPVADGLNNLYARAIDRAGNISPSTLISFTADSIAPSSVTLDPATLSLNNSHTNQEGVVIKGTIPADAHRVRISGGREVVMVTESEINSGVLYFLKYNELNPVRITAFDIAGNESSEIILNVTHDDVAPVVTIGYPLDNRTIRASGVMNGTCENLDVNIELNEVSYTTPCESGIWAFTIPSDLTHGLMVNFTISHLDLAGNESVKTLVSTIDNIAPILNVNPSSITGVFKEKSVTVTGDCEGDLIITSSGDYASSFRCMEGTFTALIEIDTEGEKNYILTTEDYAKNVTTVSFSMTFDFTPPPAITLSIETTRYHNSAVDLAELIVKGINPEGTSSVIIARDSIASVMVGTYTTAELASGINVPLLINQQNPIYVFARDIAGNLSTPAYMTLNRRQVMSRRYLIHSDGLVTDNPIGEGVTYKYTIPVTNASYETNVGLKIRVPSMTATASTGEIVISPTSDCLIREIEAHDSCSLDIEITYDMTSVGNDIAVRDNLITITFPNSLTQEISIRQRSSSTDIQERTFSNVSHSNRDNPLFTEFLTETATGSAFVNLGSFLDFDLLTNLTTDLAMRRRFQAHSPTKNYAVCSSPTTRFCINGSRNPNNPETILAGLVLNNSLVENRLSGGTPSVGIFYIGNSLGKEISIGGKVHLNSGDATSIGSAVTLYETETKTETTVQLSTENSTLMRYIYPHTGSMLSNNNVYAVGESSTETVLFRINVSNGAKTIIDNLAQGSGYAIVGNRVIYSRTDGSLVYYNTQNFTVNPVDPDMTQVGKICNNGSYERTNIRSVEERLSYMSLGSQFVIPFCDLGSSTPSSYYHYSVASGLREVLPYGEGNGMNFVISYISQSDLSRVTFGISSTSANQSRHFTYNTSTTSFESINSVLDSTLYLVGNRVFMKEGNYLREYDSNMDLISTITDIGNSNWILLRSLNSLFIYREDTKEVTYYDTTYNQILPYRNYTTGRTDMEFQGFFRGFLYFTSTQSTQRGIDRLPLFAK